MRRPYRMLLIGVLLPCLGATLLAGCSEQEAPPCEHGTKKCLNIETRDVEFDGRKHFEVRLSNTCHAEIEYKLCFEVPGGSADCRQRMLGPARRAAETIPLDQFGERTRVFVRYVREAKACRFPLTVDVTF